MVLWKYRYSLDSEGFDGDLRARYSMVQDILKSRLADYCKLTAYSQSQMKTMYTSANGESESQADSHIQQTYRDIYACKDDLADSRQCVKVSGDHIPCSTYMSLPAWSDSDETPMTFALIGIQDNLPDKITAEIGYYNGMIQKLQSAVDMANNPPMAPPGAPLPKISEGFQGATCSLEAMRAQQERNRRKALESAECNVPSLDSEINRMLRLLSSPRLNSALSECSSTLGKMIKLQNDMEEVKRKWGDAGPSKSYKKFGGGDRSKSLLFSMQQNQ